MLPIIQAYTNAAGVEVETRDISLAGRVIANFADYLTRRATHRRCACRAWRTCKNTRSKHHQITKHQCVCTAITRCH
ncbi:NADP-dependent isocitrate dehydrogenase [Pseudoalteromonas sp. Hal099]